MTMGNVLVLALTLLLAVGVLGGTARGTWRTARRTPSRQRGLSYVLASVAGTALLGLVLPAVLLGAFDPFPIWCIFVAGTVGAAAVLGWRWPALAWGEGGRPGLILTSGGLLVVLAMAGAAVT
jgi:hypothetical protein